MKERQILFKAPMVRAILDGRKSMTRRIMKLQPPQDAVLVEYHGPDYSVSALQNKAAWFVPIAGDLWPCNREDAVASPYTPGMRLWVRETCWLHKAGDATDPQTAIYYDADMLEFQREPSRWLPAWYKKTPSIHMPRWASRITLAITTVRVERLQEISANDARAEGFEFALCEYHAIDCPDAAGYCTDNTGCFADYWNTLCGNRPGVSWADNPWVWVISFERVAA